MFSKLKMNYLGINGVEQGQTDSKPKENGHQNGIKQVQIFSLISNLKCKLIIHLYRGLYLFVLIVHPRTFLPISITEATGYQ